LNLSLGSLLFLQRERNKQPSSSTNNLPTKSSRSVFALQESLLMWRTAAFLAIGIATSPVKGSLCSPSDNVNDCSGLVSLWSSTGEVLPWNNSDGSSLCTWLGVQCDYSGRVVEVDVHNLQLAGTIPNDLSFLQQVVGH
jgi:hypothetical protein